MTPAWQQRISLCLAVTTGRYDNTRRHLLAVDGGRRLASRRRPAATLVAGTIVAALGFSACASGSSSSTEPSRSSVSTALLASVTPIATFTSASSEQVSVPTAAPPATPPEATVPIETAAVPTETALSITVNARTVTAQLGDNAATTSLLAQLPLELYFADFGGQEKIARIPSPLALDGLPTGGSAEPGTIGYYAPDQSLVLYYDSVGYYPGIIPLGVFDDIAAVRDAPAFVGTMTAH